MFIKGSSGIGAHPKLHTYEEGFLLPVLTADELLVSSRHKGLLRQVRDLCVEFSQSDFDHSFGLLLHYFIEFVQLLPQESNGIMGSLLNTSLARAVTTIQKYVQFRKNASPLLKFAVFSAALLKDIGRVISNQRIVLTDEAGELFRDWNPFSGSMVGQSEFYKMYPISAKYLKIEKEATPLLARQLIAPDVFLWLSHDPVVFADWLAALLGEPGVGSKEISLAISRTKREDILAILNGLDSAPVEMIEPPEKYADDFYRWLKEGIEKGEIEVNTDKASVHVVNEGVLIEKKLFKQFADLMKLPVNFSVVYVQFGNLMGIPKKGGNDYLHAAYFSPSEGASSFTTFSGKTTQVGKGAVHEGMIVDVKDVFMKESPALSKLQSAQSMKSAFQQSIIDTSNELIKKQNPSSTSK